MIVFNKKRIEEILEGHWVNEPSQKAGVNNVVASYDHAVKIIAINDNYYLLQ